MRKMSTKILGLGILFGLSVAASPNGSTHLEISPENMGMGLRTNSAKVELSELDDRTMTLVVTANFTAPNSCSIPLETELASILNKSGNAYHISVGKVWSDRNCPAVFRPVDYEITIMRTSVDKSDIDSLEVTVNGERAHN